MQSPHKVALYHKCDLTNIKRDLQGFTNYFQQSDIAFKCIDTMWSEFTDAIYECIDKDVPLKRTYLIKLERI